MRAVLTSFGSTGDFEPFLALAMEMKVHGHEPVLAFPPQYGRRAGVFGIDFVPTGPQRLLEQVQQSLKVEVEKGTSSAAQELESYPVGDLLRAFSDLRRASSEADILICSAQWPFGRMIHELTGIPYVSIHLERFNEELAKESRDYIAAWELQLASFFSPFWTRLGLAPLTKPLTTDGNSSQLALFASSRLLLDPLKEPNWPDHHHVTGFLFVEEEWQPDPELARFVENGEPPVVFAFGSMQYDDAQLADLLLHVVRETGRRAVFVRGWSRLFEGRALPETVKAVDFVPYGWLFPRSACVVQTGGAGTTAWSLRSGVPGVYLPHISHQFSYARFAEMHGCGKVIRRDELTAERLTEAVSEVLRESSYANTARETGELIRLDSGAEEARLLIEHWYSRLGEPVQPVDSIDQAIETAAQV
jgi:UDP:flavonoid glycosyltransferase YjiC (YdhE family)